MNVVVSTAPSSKVKSDAYKLLNDKVELEIFDVVQSNLILPSTILIFVG